MGQFTKDLRVTAADNTSDAELTGIAASRGDWTITVWSVDANGDQNTPAAGTCTLQVQIAGAEGYEPVYQSDGTTAVSIDFTSAGANGSPVTTKLEGYPLQAVKAVPASLSSGSAIKMLLRYE